eukprot:Nk52_evm72s62 gene=Nk52_evmTU72s62
MVGGSVVSKGGPSSFRVAVIGGGIAGLSTAWYLCRKLPGAKVHLFEKSNHLGGWIKSDTDKEGNGFLFEQGPRTIRSSGYPAQAVIEMATELGLEKEIVSTPKDHPGAKNRFIYVDDGIYKLPSSPIEAVFKTRDTPFKGIVKAFASEPFASKNETVLSDDYDETLHSFASRRLSPMVADNLVSAMMGGIFAGDSRKLSVRSCLPLLYELEKDHGSVVKGMFLKKFPKYNFESEEAKEVAEEIKKTVVWSFNEGLQALPNKLKNDLMDKYSDRITVSQNQGVDGVRGDADKVFVEVAGGESLEFDYAVMATPSTESARMIQSSHGQLAETLREIQYVDVGLVNLGFNHKVKIPEGFGYLIPHHQKGLALGVVFDSTAVPRRPAKGLNTSENQTVLTAMIGGYKFAEFGVDPKTLSEKDLVQIAREALKSHLGIEGAPSCTSAVMLPQCIPQYYLGHHDILSRIDSQLKADPKLNRISLTGSSYLGVSVPDCINNARCLSLTIGKAAGLLASTPFCHPDFSPPPSSISFVDYGLFPLYK